MPLTALIGQPGPVRALLAALSGGTVPHAYLFGGPDGVGKEKAAVALAQALLCPTAKRQGCGTCASCQRVEKRNHPDVAWLFSEEDMIFRGLIGRSDLAGVPSREIKVEQVRALEDRLALRPLEGTWKVAIVVSAEVMNLQAQNAFLKTLEEPPPGTVLILVSAKPDRLLPTIRSRCSRVQFGPLSLEAVAARIEEEGELEGKDAELAAALAAGSLARALAFDRDALDRRRQTIESFEAFDRTDARALLAFAERYGQSREEALEALETVWAWTRDVAVAQVGAPELCLHRELADLAKRVGSRRSAEELHHRLRQIDKARTAIDRNASARLQLERMLIECAGQGTPERPS